MLSKGEVDRLELAQSIERMSAEPAWKMLIEAQTAEEARAIASLEEYLDEEKHPDREEVITRVLKWHAIRKNRMLWIQQVAEASDFKKDLRDSLLKDFLENPGPVDDRTREILMEEL